MRLGGIYEPDFGLEFVYPKNLSLFLNWGHNRPDMTAIAAVYISDGFVVGADSFRQTTTGLRLPDDQKLFAFESEGISLGYAWCGQTVVWNEDNHEQVFFDFRAVTEPILKLAALSGAVDFAGFVEHFRIRLLAQLIQSVLLKGDWVANAEVDKMARMLLVGYFKNEPSIAEIKVTRVNFTPSVLVKFFFLPKTLNVFSACESVSAENGLDRQPETPEDARLLIQEYIQRCVDDPNCKGIGGTVHTARITAKDFVWLDIPTSLAVCRDPKERT